MMIWNIIIFIIALYLAVAIYVCAFIYKAIGDIIYSLNTAICWLYYFVKFLNK